MFKLLLYKFKGENIEVDKTSKLSLVAELKGELRNSTSIINPTIRVEFNHNDFTIVDDNDILVMDDNERLVISNEEQLEAGVISSNYCYIPKFNRYYYITDIVSIRTGLWELSMSVDVLMSFKDEILNQNALVERNEFEYDLKLQDKSIDFTYSYNMIDTIVAENVGAFVDMSDPETDAPMGFVVTAITLNYPTTVTDVPEFAKIGVVQKPATRNLPYVGYATHMVFNKAEINTLLDLLKKNEFIASTVTSVRGYFIDFNEYTLEYNNFTLAATNPETDVNYAISARGILSVTPSYWKLCTFRIPPLINGSISFMDYMPYRRLNLYLPYLGFIELDNTRYINKTVKVVLTVDYNTGMGQYVLCTDDELLDTYNVKLSVDIPISTTNSMSISLAEDKAITEMWGGIIGGLTQAAAGAVMATMPGPVTTVAGTVSIVKGLTQVGTSISSAVATVNQLGVTADTKFSAGGHLTTYLPTDIILREYRATSNISDIIPMNGLLLLKDKKLSSLHGITKVKTIHLKGFPLATTDEKTAIELQLMTGVILPQEITPI